MASQRGGSNSFIHLFKPNPRSLEAGLSCITIEPMLEVIARYPTTQPHVQPPVGEDVESRALLREAHRVVKRQGINQVAKAQPLGAVGDWR
jgi:hypothetical protein